MHLFRPNRLADLVTDPQRHVNYTPAPTEHAYDDDLAEWSARQLRVVWYAFATIVGENAPEMPPGEGVLDAMADYLHAVERQALEEGVGSRRRANLIPVE